MSDAPQQSAPAASGSPDVLTDALVGRRVIHGTAVRIAGFALINLLGAVGLVILQRSLGVEDYGRYGTALALVAIVGMITDAGLTIVGVRELALHPVGEERRTIVGTLIVVRTALSAAGVAVCVLFGVVAGYGAAMTLGITMAGFGAILLAGQVALSTPLGVDMRNAALTVTELSKQVVLLGGLVLVHVLDGGLVAFLGVQVAVGAGSLAVTATLVSPADRGWPRFDRAVAGTIVRRALPVAAASILAMLYVRMLVVLASLLTTSYETGLVVASARIVEIAGGLPMLLAGVLLPVATVASRDDRVRLRYISMRATEVSLLVGGLVAVTLALAAHPIIVLLGGEAFAEAAPVLRIHAVVIATFFVIQTWIGLLLADHRQQAVVRSSLVGLAVMFVAGGVLVPLYDAPGAAIAAVAADAANLFVLALGMRGATGRPWPTSGSFVARFTLVMAAALAAGLFVPVPDVAAATIAAAVLAGGYAALGLVPSEVTDALHRRRDGAGTAGSPG